jgi:diguanylate cyclase (GGDEF)-like protein
MKTSLQIRLIILMALGSIFLISAFTAIQVNNQLRRAREFSVFRAKEGAFVVMQSLQEILSGIDPETPESDVIEKAKNTLSGLVEAGMVETAALLDKDGAPVVLEGDMRLYIEEEKGFLERLSKERDESQWFIPSIDKEHMVINMFITLKNAYGYIAKISFSLANLEKALQEVYGPVLVTVFIVIFGNIILATLLSRALITPIKLFNKVAKTIAGGHLEMKISIDTKDELEELGDTFNHMSDELVKMRARAENANPLTKLPGNIVIREEAEKKITEDKRFILIYSDLDNFKAFNDKYGIEAGDKAIMLSADIFKEAVAKEGNAEDDFVGHEGGDDFLILTTPERARRIGDYITKTFDERIRALYSKEDLERGCIEAKGRDNIVKKFPIMTISLVGAGNVTRKITSYPELTNIAAELKHKAKETDGSVFLIDRRTEDRGTAFRER